MGPCSPGGQLRPAVRAIGQLLIVQTSITRRFNVGMHDSAFVEQYKFYGWDGNLCTPRLSAADRTCVRRLLS